MTYVIEFPIGQGTEFKLFRYPAGETQVRFEEAHQEYLLKADYIRVIADIRSGDDVMGLCLLTNALEELVPETPTDLFLPYLPYGRADRRFAKGDCFALETFANIINSLGYARVLTYDVHSPVAGQYIRRLINISAKPLIEKVLAGLDQGDKTAIVLLPDAGASRYGFGALQCTKHRDPESGRITSFEVPEKELFKDASAILVIDDICDGGWTFTNIGKTLKEYDLGIPVHLYVSHGIFSKGVSELLQYYERIHTTDSFRTPYPGVSRYPVFNEINVPW